MLIIAGNAIHLRDWKLEDVDAWAYWLHPDHTWNRFDGPYYPRTDPAEIPAMADKLRGKIAANEWPTPRQRLVIANAATDALLGVVSWYWIGEETHWPALGIVIYDSNAWGKGIGYEALGLWSDYLFRAMPKFMRLDLRTWSGNHGMMRLALKLGYVEEARFRMARLVDGHYYDGLGYGVLRDEWLARYPDGFAREIVNVSDQSLES